MCTLVYISRATQAIYNAETQLGITLGSWIAAAAAAEQLTNVQQHTTDNAKYMK